MIRCLSEEVQARLRSGVAVSSVSQCVEELVLNSIDAEATCIAVRVDTEAGKVQVVDNGSGVSKDDLEKVGTRYCTSKCRVVEDLENLKFYGFRGEALASIADVATTVQISTKRNKSVKTFGKIFQSGKPLDVYESEDSRPSSGTTVTVYNLFYNLPVRRKCMDCVLEYERIRQRIEAISLMHPAVSFSMRNDGSGAMVVQLPKRNNIVSRFGQIYGLGKSQKLREINHKQSEFEIFGYISSEGHYNKNIQFLYVNSRLVLKTRLHKLMDFLLRKQSLSCRTKNSPRYKSECSSPSHSKMSAELYGIYILNIKCQYSYYDVCMEPTKTLIEFRNWDSLLCSVETGVKNFLTKENLIIEPSSEDCKEFSEESSFSLSSAVVQVEKSDKGNLQECFQKACQDIMESHKIIPLASKAVSRMFAVRPESAIETLDCSNNCFKGISKVVKEANKCLASVPLSAVQGVEIQNDLASDDENKMSSSCECLTPERMLQDQGLNTSDAVTSVPNEELLLCKMGILNSLGKEVPGTKEPKEDGNQYQNKTETASSKMPYKGNKLLITKTPQDKQHENYSELFNATHSNILVEGCSAQQTTDCDEPRDVPESVSVASKHAENSQAVCSLNKHGHLQDILAFCPKTVTNVQKADSVTVPFSERERCFTLAGIKLHSPGLVTHVAQKKEEINKPSAGYRTGPVSARDIFQEKRTKPQTLFSSAKGAASQTFRNDFVKVCGPFSSSIKPVNFTDTICSKDKYKSSKSKQQNCSESEKTSLSEVSGGILTSKKQSVRLSFHPKSKIRRKLRMFPLSESLERFCRDYGKTISVPKSNPSCEYDNNNALFDPKHSQVSLKKFGTTEQPCCERDLWEECSKDQQTIYTSGLVTSECVPVLKDNLLPVCPELLGQNDDLNSMGSNIADISEHPDKCNLVETIDNIVKDYSCTVEKGSPLSLSGYLQSRKMFLVSCKMQCSLATKLSRMKDDPRCSRAMEENRKLDERKEASHNLGSFETANGSAMCPFPGRSTVQEDFVTSHFRKGRKGAPICSTVVNSSDCLGDDLEGSPPVSNVPEEFPSHDCSSSLVEHSSACCLTSVSSERAEIPPVSADQYFNSSAEETNSADLQNYQLASTSNDNSPPKKTNEQNSQSEGSHEALSSVWMEMFDTTLGRMVYINKLTGLSSYDAPCAEETHVLCETDTTTAAVNVVSESVGMCKSDDSLQALFSEWKNPVFAHCPEVAVNIGTGQSGGLAVKIHNILYPYRFTKEMIHTMKVLQQVDTKFIACLVKTRSVADPVSGGSSPHWLHSVLLCDQL
ncbi:DNA mismatch repair protein Mlh3 [Protopterus annectens]|uniref:DNA mismatch repair protein Mlh3 n=1 Tax=Protopterus annectens TaxID=7888 RepID=UPI001CF9D952|nr:DNA mismatch repair protein Mlh3 [Protopterus annectens]